MPRAHIVTLASDRLVATRIVATDLDHTRRSIQGRLDRKTVRQQVRIEAFLDETPLEDAVASLAFRALTLARRFEPTEADADAFAWEYDAGRRARPLAVHLLGRLVRRGRWSVEELIDTVLPYVETWPQRRRAAARLDPFRRWRRLVAATVATPASIGIVSTPVARTLRAVHRGLEGFDEPGRVSVPNRRRCRSAREALDWLLRLRAAEHATRGAPGCLAHVGGGEQVPAVPARIRAGFNRGRGDPRAPTPRARRVFAELDRLLDDAGLRARPLLERDARTQSSPGLRAAFRLSSS